MDCQPGVEVAVPTLFGYCKMRVEESLPTKSSTPRASTTWLLWNSTSTIGTAGHRP